jgi:hypothetical protein
MKKSLALIDDLIALETEREKKHKAWCYKNHKATHATGESEILFHLKQLKDLVAAEHETTINAFTGKGLEIV